MTSTRGLCGRIDPVTGRTCTAPAPCPDGHRREPLTARLAHAVRRTAHAVRCAPPADTFWHDEGEIVACPTGEHAWQLKESEGRVAIDTATLVPTGEMQWVRVR